MWTESPSTFYSCLVTYKHFLTIFQLDKLGGEKKELVKIPTTHKITLVLGSFCEAKEEHSMDTHSVFK